MTEPGGSLERPGKGATKAQATRATLVDLAAELGLGVLEAIGIEPKSRQGWADIHNRMARGMQLPPDDRVRPAGRTLLRRRG